MTYLVWLLVAGVNSTVIVSGAERGNIPLFLLGVIGTLSAVWAYAETSQQQDR